MDQPRLDDIDHEAERQERIWQYACAVTGRLDAGELITELCVELAAESADTPIVALINEWKCWPQFDWSHPAITPSQASRIGRYVASVLAEVMGKALERALAMED